MSDYSTFLKTIKQAAVEAVNAQNPVQICFGTVTKTDPLTVAVDQKISLTEEFLILTKTVTEDALAADDEVILLRAQGGQKYVVIDRIGGGADDTK